MKIRIGLPKPTGSLPIACENLQAPALISASSMWDNKRKRFRSPGFAINDLDIALDSAGFVAMTHYRGYPWTVEQYVELAGLHSWAWWAQMDFCCEPELAGNQYLIDAHVWASAYNLAYCTKVARTWREQGAFWIQDPTPVLQGWAPADYLSCIDLYDDLLLGKWPDLVGVGSVCRRHLHGPDGLLAIIREISNALPDNVGLHLFGVKGAALSRLDPKVVSIDSSAWQFRARMAAREKRVSCTIKLKTEIMKDWYSKQQEQL